jgi:CHAD domain-containing protein
MNHLLAYYQQQKDTLIQKMDSLKEKMDVEELHDLRVTHKRLRAFFRMLKKTGPELLPDEEDYNHIRSFYKTAGKVRDLHVQDKEMSKHEKDLGIDLQFLHDYIAEREEKAEKDFYDALNSFDRGVYERYLQKLEQGLHQDDLFKWYRTVVDFTHNQLKKTEKTISKADTAKKLHKIRSKLKDAFYYLEIINSEETFENIPDDEVKQAQSFLGDWHDNVVSYEFIQEFEQVKPQIAKKNTGTLEILGDYLVQKIHFH